MKSNTGNTCCGCFGGIIVLLIILALVLGFVISRFVSVDQAGIADQEGILSRFDDKYSESDTLRSQGMENWAVWDFVMWIIKSGDYEASGSSQSNTRIGGMLSK